MQVRSPVLTTMAAVPCCTYWQLAMSNPCRTLLLLALPLRCQTLSPHACVPIFILISNAVAFRFIRSRVRSDPRTAHRNGSSRSSPRLSRAMNAISHHGRTQTAIGLSVPQGVPVRARSDGISRESKAPGWPGYANERLTIAVEKLQHHRPTPLGFCEPYNLAYSRPSLLEEMTLNGHPSPGNNPR